MRDIMTPPWDMIYQNLSEAVQRRQMKFTGAFPAHGGTRGWRIVSIPSSPLAGHQSAQNLPAIASTHDADFFIRIWLMKA